MAGSVDIVTLVCAALGADQVEGRVRTLGWELEGEGFQPTRI